MTAGRGAREQRLVFGEAPDLYDRARPGYPEPVIDEVLAYVTGSDAAAGLRVVEVGAGTGKATVSLAARGAEILAIEPDADMAAIARRNCERYGSVRFEEVEFERWRLVPGGYDLVLSAQAWHWVRPEVAYGIAHTALRAGGALALLWNRIRWPDGDPVRDELEVAYRRLAPELHAKGPGFPGLLLRPFDDRAGAQVSATGLFTDVEERWHPWQRAFSSSGFVALLRTQSDHRMAPASELEPLLEQVGRIVERRGGELVVPYETYVVLARARPG